MQLSSTYGDDIYKMTVEAYELCTLVLLIFTCIISIKFSKILYSLEERIYNDIQN